MLPKLFSKLKSLGEAERPSDDLLVDGLGLGTSLAEFRIIGNIQWLSKMRHTRSFCIERYTHIFAIRIFITLILHGEEEIYAKYFFTYSNYHIWQWCLRNKSNTL